MTTIVLTPEEREFLVARLHKDLDELRMEIAHTDKAQYRAGLKQDAATVQRILDKLASLVAIGEAI